VENLLFLLNYK